jgi:hypothetical protein
MTLTTSFNSKQSISQLMDNVQTNMTNWLNDYLSEFSERYELLEATHKSLLNLPSIAYELNKCKTESKPDPKVSEKFNGLEFPCYDNLSYNEYDQLKNSIKDSITNSIVVWLSFR